jgi:hypothetical protein
MLRTGDMDIVYPKKELESVLTPWAFALGRGMRAWANEELGLAVDMVGGELSGSGEKLTTITTEYGPAVIVGVEDLILRRLASAKHWRVPTDMEQAYLLARAYEDTVDWTYVKAQAEKDMTGDYLQKLESMLKRPGRTARSGAVLDSRLTTSGVEGAGASFP